MNLCYLIDSLNLIGLVANQIEGTVEKQNLWYIGYIGICIIAKKYRFLLLINQTSKSEPSRMMSCRCHIELTFNVE